MQSSGLKICIFFIKIITASSRKEREQMGCIHEETLQGTLIVETCPRLSYNSGTEQRQALCKFPTYVLSECVLNTYFLLKKTTLKFSVKFQGSRIYQCTGVLPQSYKSNTVLPFPETEMPQQGIYSRSQKQIIIQKSAQNLALYLCI